MKKNYFYPVFPNGKEKVFTLSYDDGIDSDEKLVEMMRRHGVRGTFNICSGRMPDEPQPHDETHLWRKMTVQKCLEVYGEDMEIAIHGANHPWWARLPSDAAMLDILEDRRALERMTGKIIRGGAYPEGSFSDSVVETLRLAGVAYCRTTKSTGDLTVLPGDPLRLRPTCHHTDPRLMELAQKFADAPQNGKMRMFYVWGHTFEFVRENNWQLMEDLLTLVGGREDVWYATNIEMIDYLDAVKRLEYNVDQTLVHNPTATELWLCCSGAEPVCVPAGATVSL